MTWVSMSSAGCWCPHRPYEGSRATVEGASVRWRGSRRSSTRVRGGFLRVLRWAATRRRGRRAERGGGPTRRVSTAVPRPRGTRGAAGWRGPVRRGVARRVRGAAHRCGRRPPGKLYRKSATDDRSRYRARRFMRPGSKRSARQAAPYSAGSQIALRSRQAILSFTITVLTVHHGHIHDSEMNCRSVGRTRPTRRGRVTGPRSGADGRAEHLPPAYATSWPR